MVYRQASHSPTYPLDRQHLSLLLRRTIQKIRPPLHHLAALIQVAGVVKLGRANLVAFHTGHLPLDRIGVESGFVQSAGGVGAKAVGCAFVFTRLAAVVAEVENCAAHSVIAHAFFAAFF